MPETWIAVYPMRSTWFVLALFMKLHVHSTLACHKARVQLALYAHPGLLPMLSLMLRLVSAIGLLGAVRSI